MYVRLTQNEELVANGVNILFFTHKSYVFVGYSQHTEMIYTFLMNCNTVIAQLKRSNIAYFYTSLIPRKLRR